MFELSHIILIAFAVLLIILMGYDRLVRRRGREPGMAFNILLVLSVVTSFVTHAIVIFELRWLLLFFTATTTIPFLFEAMGLRYGFVFGKYEYTEKAAPIAAFGVPVGVVLIWPSLLYLSLLAGTVLLRFTIPYPLPLPVGQLILITALVATISDGFIEPIMVDNGYWRWIAPAAWLPGKWQGIPVSNFVGWYVVAATALTAAFFGLQIDPPVDTVPSQFAFPLLWVALAGVYSSGEAKRIHRPLMAVICIFLAILMLLLFTGYLWVRHG